MSDTTQYQHLLEVLADLERRERRARLVLRDLEAVTERQPEGTPLRRIFEGACLAADRMLSHVKTLRAQAQTVKGALEAKLSQADDPAQFARDWIVLHGISRGMPPDWNRGGTVRP